MFSPKCHTTFFQLFYIVLFYRNNITAGMPTQAHENIIQKCPYEGGSKQLYKIRDQNPAMET